MTKRIGLHGGSFDPVHLGHLALGRAAHEQLRLDELRWIPAGQPWQKARTLAPAQHRVAMLRLALDGMTGHVVDTREVEREGPSYTIDTVESMLRDREHVRDHACERAGDDPYREDVEWFLVLGQDQFGQLHTWHRWRDLVAQVHFAVVARGGQLAQVSDEVRPTLPRGAVVEMPVHSVSSTQVRRRVSEGGSAQGMVPDAVARYIETNGLYRTHAAAAHGS